LGEIRRCWSGRRRAQPQGYRRNINTGFGLAVTLARAKNLAEIIELQAAYWNKHLGELAAQAGEMRALSSKVTADVAAPIRTRALY
jgi:hypothetical protein